MAFAKGGLAVPLKTFTIQLLDWLNGNSPLSRAKCGVTLTTMSVGARGNSELVGIGNNEHPKHRSNRQALNVRCWMLEIFISQPPLNRCLTRSCASAFAATE